MFRSLRWRLTGWYILLLAGVLLLFSSGIYLAVRELLLDTFDDVLRHQAELIAQTVDFTAGGPVLDPAAQLAGRPDREHFTRLYRADGTLSFDDSSAAQAPALPYEVADALKGHNQLTQVRGHKGTLRVATYPIFHNGQVAGVLQLGVSLEDLNDTMHGLLKILLVLAPLTLLLASGGGLFLADRALAPIDRITRTAQRISAENLSGRIGLHGQNDEVGRLAQTFDAMLARLEAAFARQRQFAADASHELRTPLTAIIGQIDVAIERPRSAESYRATLVAVREQTQRLARLASDLLFLARADASPAAVTFEVLELDDLLPAIIAQVEPLAVARGQSLTRDLQPSIRVRGNEDQLIRLILNLLDNAIRYTPAGGCITVHSAQHGSEAAISISDSGPGIAPEHLPHLFDRFFRIDRARGRAQGGNGLGLAIAQSIAQAHGGRIHVTSAVGRGSTFTLFLPALDHADALTGASSDPHRASAPRRIADVHAPTR
jgi:heavy metal sensor kinase